MQQQWRIRIRGKQREQVSVDLLVQAVMALGRQLHDEAVKNQSTNGSGFDDPKDASQKEEDRS